MLGKSLASRAALLTGTIAAVAVLIAGAVALPLIRGAAENQVRESLSRQADLVQDVANQPEDFDFDPQTRPGRMDRPDQTLMSLVSYLRAQGIEVQGVIPGIQVPRILTSEQVTQIANGISLSAKNCDRRNCFFIEARPIGIGTGVVLLQADRVAGRVSKNGLGQLGIALVLGFIAAVLFGLLAARKLTQPLAQAAQAAHRLAMGERDVRLEPQGPTEVAEIAEALNILATELTRSEGRQREFLMSVSHELRTPLTAIRGYAEGMSDGIVPSEDLAKVGQIIEAESVRLDRLVSDLLDLARTGAVDFPINLQTIDLRNVLEDAAQVWQARAEREEVNFNLMIPNEPVMVSTDAMRVRQIIDNLAENALRVTPAGQQIVFQLDQQAVLEVRDSGPGLTADDESVAFQPGELFERYRGVRKVGTGFGLALVGRLASRLGAQASVARAAEGGAAFRIDFGTVLLGVN